MAEILKVNPYVISKTEMERIARSRGKIAVRRGNMSQNEMQTVFDGLVEKNIRALPSIGWGRKDIQALMDVICFGSDQMAIGVWGSMSRGREGYVNKSSGDYRLATRQSDLDLIFISPQCDEEQVALFKADDLFGRRVDVFTYTPEAMKYWPQLGINSREVRWVYKNEAVYRDYVLSQVYDANYGYGMAPVGSDTFSFGPWDRD